MSSTSSLSQKLVHFNGRILQRESVIAGGGYSYVEKAVDSETLEEYALKTMLLRTKEDIDAAKQEISIYESFDVHPNIVEYFGHVQTKKGQTDEMCLVLEYCGSNLVNQLMNCPELFDVKTIVRIIMDIAMALNHLHCQKKPIYHRDVKLENIVLSKKNIYKICDFGSATTETYDTSKMTNQELLNVENIIQRSTTLIYRAPEMVDLYQRQVIDEKADIWMLGCILYTLLYHQNPFQDVSILAIISAQFDIPEEKLRSTPSKLIDLLFWCLSPLPVDRPDASTLVSLLDKYQTTPSYSNLLPPSVISRRSKYFSRFNAVDEFPPIYKQVKPSIMTRPYRTSSKGKKTQKLICTLSEVSEKATSDFNTSWVTTNTNQHANMIQDSFPCFNDSSS